MPCARRSGVAGQPAAPALLAIQNGRLVDGTGAPPREGITVLIKGDRIAAVGAASEIKVPPDARVIDAAGKTILPV